MPEVRWCGGYTKDIQAKMRSHDVVARWCALWIEEVSELHRLAMKLPSHPKIVNLGGGAGTSTMALAEVRLDAHIYTVDIALNQLELHNMTEAGLQSLMTQLGNGSIPESANWIHGPVDMIFVDADHSYAGCHGDILAWQKHLKIGGILACHDYNISTYPGVVQAIDELLMNNPDYEFLGRATSIVSFRRIK